MLARCAELWECGAQKSQSSHGALKGRLHVQGTGKGGGGKSGISPILITSKKEKIRVQFRIQRERGRNDEKDIDSLMALDLRGKERFIS